MPSTPRHKSTRHQLHVCISHVQTCLALPTAYSLVQWLNFYILSLRYAKCPTQPAYHRCFPDDGVASTYIFLQRSRDKVRLLLPEWGLKPQVKTENSSGLWCWMNNSGSFWWHSRLIYQRMKCTNLFTRVIVCQCTVDGTYVSRVRTLKFI